MKPKKLKSGDKIAIVSLSSGELGESFCKHQLELGIKRLKEFGLEPVFMTNSLKGTKFLDNNPEAKANDLIEAFANDDIKGILCAIGGFNTYKTVPLLLNNELFKEIVQKNPKIFIGFSDTTVNHLMFRKLGLNTFYGHSFLVDFAELDFKMLEYSKKSFEMLFYNNKDIEIKASKYWFEERKDFSINSMGTPRIKHLDKKGYQVLRGIGNISGELIGGCLDTLYSLINQNSPKQEIANQFNLVPKNDEWKGKILFIETSEAKENISYYQKLLEELEKIQTFKNVNAIIVGKPQDENFYEEYKKILLNITEKYKTPILYNVNFGHSHPKTIIPYGIKCEINFDLKKIIYRESFFDETE